ncbi:hypothetical protein DPMN_104520 [Dreissena polymorpha]|uniref:Uncharacterized protein n=1 Tax=Dreissena polymorpha TaxID=45954 RepID=A0A9D4K325_DREPO|nr:hypothetical protein DPMN_104520 [Dreissena polymorpha]
MLEGYNQPNFFPNQARVQSQHTACCVREYNNCLRKMLKTSTGRYRLASQFIVNQVLRRKKLVVRLANVGGQAGGLSVGWFGGRAEQACPGHNFVVHCEI